MRRMSVASASRAQVLVKCSYMTVLFRDTTSPVIVLPKGSTKHDECAPRNEPQRRHVTDTDRTQHKAVMAGRLTEIDSDGLEHRRDLLLSLGHLPLQQPHNQQGRRPGFNHEIAGLLILIKGPPSARALLRSGRPLLTARRGKFRVHLSGTQRSP